MTSAQWTGAAMMLGTSFLSAVSQILLKQSADRPHATPAREYLNWRVLTAYAIFAATVVVNILAFRVLDYKYGGVLMATSYVFVLLLSRLVLREKIAASTYWGNALIAAGVALYLCA